MLRTISGRIWARNQERGRPRPRQRLAQVYYANLPKYLGAAFPLPGPKDINTAHHNDLVLPQASLTYLPPGPRVIQSFEPTLPDFTSFTIESHWKPIGRHGKP